MQKIQKVYKLAAQNCLSKLLLAKRNFSLTMHLLQHIHIKCEKMQLKITLLIPT